MNDTVFWSWQNDYSGKTNRHFIRDALLAAVNLVSAELDVEDAERLVLDHDTKSTAGMADISHTILEKIAKAAVMIADVTPIAVTTEDKALPNPNVMVELGYALHALGSERIVAVLNTSSGHSANSLPFDIRHRRILIYALPDTADKSERKRVREKLTIDLAEAIRINIRQVRDQRSQDTPIQGVDADERYPGLWKSDWPVIHSDGLHGTQRVRPHDLDRAWLRVIPASYSNGIPSITDVEDLPDSVRIWAPAGTGFGVNAGTCPFGYISYWLAGRDDDGTCKARNLAVYLDATGEIWSSDGEALSSHRNEVHINSGRLMSNWANGLERSMKCLDALGASKRRRVVIGITGIEGALWLNQDGYNANLSRKREMVLDETDLEWSDERQTQFLHKGWNKLLDAFSRPALSEEEFLSYHRIRKRN